VQQFYNSAGDDVTPHPLLPPEQRSQQGAALFMGDSRSVTVSSAFTNNYGSGTVARLVGCERQLFTRYSPWPTGAGAFTVDVDSWRL